MSNYLYSIVDVNGTQNHFGPPTAHVNDSDAIRWFKGLVNNPSNPALYFSYCDFELHRIAVYNYVPPVVVPYESTCRITRGVDQLDEKIRQMYLDMVQKAGISVLEEKDEKK